MTLILGVDPGETHSGVVLFDTFLNQVVWARDMTVAELEHHIEGGWLYRPDTIVCENIVPMGVPFSSNLRATCRTIDRAELIAEQLRITWVFVTRNEVKIVLCGRCKGVKDANVSCAVQERFGGRKAALGTKKEPGPLHGVSGHCWQALAAVLTAIDPKGGEQ